MTDDEKMIFRNAIQVFGRTAQCVVAIEELAELQKALTKFLRGKIDSENLAEEMADTGIMLDQITLIFDNRSAVDEWRTQKVARLRSLSDKTEQTD